MKFEITTTSYDYDKKDSDKLKSLGFEFKTESHTNLKGYERYSKKDKKVFKEINSIDELMEFVKQYKKVIIYENTIEIYDNYRE